MSKVLGSLRCLNVSSNDSSPTLRTGTLSHRKYLRPVIGLCPRHILRARQGGHEASREACPATNRNAAGGRPLDGESTAQEAKGLRSSLGSSRKAD